MVLPPLTFMVDPTMNLISGHHHECERREYHSPCYRSPKNYSFFRPSKALIFLVSLTIISQPRDHSLCIICGTKSERGITLHVKDQSTTSSDLFVKL